MCLKYQTTKAAEVGRLISSLEKLSRTMAALPDVSEGMSFGLLGASFMLLSSSAEWLCCAALHIYVDMFSGIRC